MSKHLKKFITLIKKQPEYEVLKEEKDHLIIAHCRPTKILQDRTMNIFGCLNKKVDIHAPFVFIIAFDDKAKRKSPISKLDLPLKEMYEKDFEYTIDEIRDFLDNIIMKDILSYY